MRTDRETWFLDIAERCAKQATCNRRCFGAVIVDKEGTIVSTGYNGAPCGEVDCLQRGTCRREELNIPAGEKYELCMSVHGEANAIIQAGKEARGATIYIVGLDAKTGGRVDSFPCMMCMRLIKNAKIIKIVYIADLKVCYHRF